MSDSSNDAEHVTVPDPDGGKGRHLTTLRAFLVAIGSVLIVFVGIPFALIAFAFWAAEGAWIVEGKGIRYWLFISGTRMERIGLVQPLESAPQYSVSLQEGTFPGWAVVSYTSKAEPDAIIDVYAERCGAMKTKVTRPPVTDQPPDTVAIRLECEFEPYITADISPNGNCRRQSPKSVCGSGAANRRLSRKR